MVVEAIKVLHQARINRCAEQIGNLIPLPPTARCDWTQHRSRPTCDRHSEPLSCFRPTYQLAGVLSHLSESHFSCARKVATRAGELMRLHERASARAAYLRASEYHRQSYFFLRHDLGDPRLRAAHRAHVETFQSAMELMNHPAETAAIPYAGTHLKGYFFAPDNSAQPRPDLAVAVWIRLDRRVRLVECSCGSAAWLQRVRVRGTRSRRRAV